MRYSGDALCGVNGISRGLDFSVADVLGVVVIIQDPPFARASASTGCFIHGFHSYRTESGVCLSPKVRRIMPLGAVITLCSVASTG